MSKSNLRGKKMLSLLLAAAMVLTMMPLTAAAEADDCTHECTDNNCAYIEGIPCDHQHDDSCGEDDTSTGVETPSNITGDCIHNCEDGPCTYMEPVACDHQHDGDCGGLSAGRFRINQNSADIIIADFDMLDDFTLYQGYDLDRVTLADLDLPDILTGTDVDGNAITIDPVTWQSNPDFDPAKEVPWPGYIFSPVLPEGYLLADSVNVPVITVFIRPEIVFTYMTDQNTLDLDDPPATGGRYRVYTSGNGKHIIVDGADPITIIGDGTAEGWSIGVSEAVDITIGEGTVINSNSNAGYAFWVPGNGIITGQGSDIRITTSTIYIDGFFTMGDITFAGTMGSISGQSGIHAEGDVVIVGTVGDITSTGTMGYEGGIYSKGDVLITGTTGIISGMLYSINTPYGSTTIGSGGKAVLSGKHNTDITVRSGGLLKAADMLTAETGCIIVLENGSKVEGMDGQFTDRGRVFNISGQVTVGAVDAEPSESGLSAGTYVWNGSAFVKIADGSIINYGSSDGTNDSVTGNNGISNTGLPSSGIGGASHNIVNITGGTVNIFIAGGEHRAVTGSVVANNNQVNVSNFAGSGDLAISGGFAQAQSPGNTATANGNTVDIVEGSYSIVRGGTASSDDGPAFASDNRVHVAGVTVGFVTGGEGGVNTHTSTATATANNNQVFVADSVVLFDIYGGRAGTAQSPQPFFHNNNSVTLGGEVTVGGGVYGGAPNDWIQDGSAYNNGSGNALNIEGSTDGSINVDGNVQYFQSYNFKIPTSATSGSAMLSVGGTAYVNGATIGLDFGGVPVLALGSKITLIDGMLDGAPTTTALSVGIYTFEIAVENGKLVATVTAVTKNTDNSSNGGGGSSYTSSTNITIEKQPDKVTMVKQNVSGTVKDSILSFGVAEKMVKDAINAVTNKADGIGVGFDLSGTDYGNIIGTIDRAALEALKEAGVRYVQFTSQVLNLTMDLKTIEAILQQTTGNVTFSAVKPEYLSDEEKSLLGNRPVFDITIQGAEGVNVSTLNGGMVIIGIPYQPAATEKTGCIYGIYVDETGSPHLLDQSSYNNGQVIFRRNSLSRYGVGYKTPAPAFTDTDNHWAMNHIDFAVSRELISGTTATTYNPDAAVTYGDFLTAIGRFAGVDVRSCSNAMPYFQWAVENEIVQGVDMDQFNPRELISRQEMAIMMVNYGKAIGCPLPVSRQYAAFVDDGLIDADAKAAVKAVQQAGIMGGKSGNMFEPAGNVTRGEAAAILHRFAERTIAESTARGWVQNDSGQWHYININGAVAVNTTIGGYEVDAAGVWNQ